MPIEFGDFDPDDAYDPNEPADPEQVAIKLHQLRIDHGLESHPWDELTNDQKLRRIAVLGILIEWLQRQGSMR